MPSPLLTLTATPLSDHFRPLDWAVLVGYLALVSVLGVYLAGRQQTMADFFRGGNRLPWYAVTGSMIATIISAVTFIGVPAAAYRPGGNFTYLQLGIVAGLLSRLFVVTVLIPAYYRHRVYSPYDYMGQRLGEAARSVTTALFTLLGLLAQAARLYLTAVILTLILEAQLGWLAHHTGLSPLAWAVLLISAVAVAWTMLGGIATVVWTDAILFLVFVTGGLVALVVVATALPGGFGQLFASGYEAGKFQLWSLFEPSAGPSGGWASPLARVFAEPYTLWAALFAVTLGNIGTYGTDQLIAQRIFTCRNQRDAKIAILASYAGELVVALMLLVGVGLWAYYGQFPERLTGAAAAAVEHNPDNIFPVFILTAVPVGLTGLIVAGIFAAAISSLTSILAALAQTTLSAVYLPLRNVDPDAPTTPGQDRHLLRLSRALIVFWGAALAIVALLIDLYVTAQRARGNDVPFLDLALGLTNYVVGSLLGAFLLAWLPLRVNAWGLVWAAPLSVFTVYASRFHDGAALALCLGVSAALLLAWLAAALTGRHDLRRRRLARTAWLLAGCGLMLLVWWGLWFAKTDPATGLPLRDAGGAVARHPIAWPWYAPLGGGVTLLFGYLLADHRPFRPAPPDAIAAGTLS